MDREFLADPAVVTASRAFVCIRLATYESEREATFVADLYLGPDGQAKNTVFAILGPDGKERVTSAGRSPGHVFRGRDPDAQVAEMIATMARTAKRHPAKAVAPVALPYAPDLRLGLNMASCDLSALVVVAEEDDAKRARLERRLAALAWSEELVGDLSYAPARTLAELDVLDGADGKPGIYVVAPDEYGLRGKVLAHASGDEMETLHATLTKARDAYRPKAKDSRRHIRDARRAGIAWESVLPVTDGPEHERR